MFTGPAYDNPYVRKSAMVKISNIKNGQIKKGLNLLLSYLKNPRKKLCEDIIGPYKICRKVNPALILKSITIL